MHQKHFNAVKYFEGSKAVVVAQFWKLDAENELLVHVQDQVIRQRNRLFSSTNIHWEFYIL